MTQPDTSISTPPKVLIWSIQHKAWWRPKSQGYTINIACAGLYEHTEAMEIVKGGNSKEEKIVDLQTAFETLQLQAFEADRAIIAAMRALRDTDIGRRS